MATIVPNKLIKENKNYGRTINQLMKFFIEKEMKNRGINEFRSAIVEIFDNKNKPAKVYLNGEAVFEFTFKKENKFKAGRNEKIDLKDIKKISWCEKLLNKNSAKFFIIKWNDSCWILHFDFRYNRNTAKKKINRAKEFLESTKEISIKNKNTILYLLWSATELIIDTRLCLLPQQKPKKSHKDRTRKIQTLRSTLNIFSQKLLETFEILTDGKEAARYGGKIDNKVFNKKFFSDTIILLEKEIKNITI